MRRLLLHFVCVTFLMVALPAVALAQGFPPAKPALDFIASHPDDSAVLCYMPGSETPEFSHNADEPFALASTYKLVILAEMARQIDARQIDPDEQVLVANVNTYWLPGTDGNAHQMWLDSLKPGQDKVTLGDVAYAMIRFSSNAAPDYLLNRLGKDGFPKLFELLDLQHTDLPVGSYLGLYLARDNHETGKVNLADMNVKFLSPERERLEKLYLKDEAWKKAEQTYEAKNIQALTTARADVINAEVERQAIYFQRFGMKGSARDMLKIMSAAFGKTTFSEKARTFMKSKLNWIMDVNPANKAVYDDLGEKGGTWASILTGVWYVTPKGGQSIALAVFYKNLPFDLWTDWATTGAQQGLELRAVAGGEGCGIFDTLKP